MTKFVSLEATSFVEETSEVDPHDDWDRASTATTWQIHGLSLSEKDSWKALPVDDDIVPGTILYAVYAIYSSGDSFGHDEGSDLELVSLHRTRELAEKNKEAIKERGHKSYGTQLIIELDNGEKIERYCPWDGYFESLDSVECRGFTVY